MTCRTLLFIVACVMLLLPRRAWAEPTSTDKATAQALFDDALQRMKAQDYERARQALEESLRLDPAMGTRYQLAQCYEALGRTASAWSAYVELADLARVANQGLRTTVARERALALEPRLSHLVVAVDAPVADGLLVQRGDLVIGPAQWGVAIPIDQGTYHLTARAVGRQSWAGDVTVSKDGETVSVRVPLLPLLPGGPPAPAAARLPDAAARRPSRLRRNAGLVTIGTGVVAIGVGVGMGFAARAEYNSVGAHCHGSSCDGPGLATTSSARALGDAATVVVGIGAAAGVAGLVLWLTAPGTTHVPQNTLRVGLGTITLDVGF